MSSVIAKGVGRYLYPAETSRHAATILGFPSKYALAPAYYEHACTDIASLASAISAFEPVRLYARSEDVGKAQSMVKLASETYPNDAANISFIPFQTNHLWVRDTGPVYVQRLDEASQQKRFAINFRFSEWGKKDDIGDHDRASDGLDWPVMAPEQLEENNKFAERVIKSDSSPSPVTIVESEICVEGGALVVDGDGTLLATESSILNENRNPGLSREAIEVELKRVLGVEKIIWFPGRKDLDVTDVHADAEPDPTVPSAWLEIYEEIKEILSKSVDAKGRPFEVHTVDEPSPNVFGDLAYEEPATNYVNFYFVNGGLILPQFGDQQKDREAVETLQKLCPDRVVRPVRVTGLPLAGGVIHCSTQQVLSVEDI
ncbi:hypothetical protein N7509_006724 [Penicillium cosmopolitanum]|uniref:Porphyromonas-type peptidyl-arginine deiminase superfamily n=1 Tax=Penicillium cosmopolitanum TaxID=1131564 RepID=A0A9X0B7P8_9EURO|nr:uncharacterized protein N7509_006724 [Penicillium cosmopolitanum]KAJ5391234.1 hypothetical protein N7509_006724 [Penicillium cosmopolitanum]